MTEITQNIIRHFKNELIYGAHLTALIGPSVAIIPIIMLGLPVNYISLLIAYLVPLVVYSYDYQKGMDKDSLTNSEKAKYLGYRKSVFPILFWSYLLLALILIVVIFDPIFFTFLLIVLAGGILYTTIFKRLSREVPAFKNIYSTAIWAYFGTFFTIFLYRIYPDLIFLVIFLFIYLKIFINNVFFDIKDIEADKKEGLKTIPILLGKRKTIYILSAINVLSVVVLAFSAYIGIIPLYALSLAVLFFYTQYYLVKSLTAESTELLNYTYIISESEFIFWPIVLMIGHILI